MRKKFITKANAGRNMFSVVICIVITLIITLILALGVTKLIYEGFIGLHEVGYLSTPVWAISIMTGVFAIGRFRKTDFMRGSALIGCAYWSAMLAIGIFMPELSMASCLICLLIIFAVVLCANYLNFNNQRVQHTKRKRSYR